MTAHYLTIQATKPVQFASCGRVETSHPFRHPTRTLDSYVLLIGLQGTLEIEQEDQVYTLTKGKTLLLKKGIQHVGPSHSLSPLSYYWFHFYLDDELASYLSIDDVDEQLASMIQEPSSQIFSSTIYIPTYSKPLSIERLNILFNQLLDLSQAGAHAYLAATYLMTSLLIELSNQTIDSHRKKKRPLDHELAHIIEWIRVNADQEQSVQGIAEYFHYNPNYLSRQFKTKIGMSLQRYINLVKITKAKDLLSSTRKSIREISLSIGIDDEKYFMRLFKKTEGMTPSEFRKAFYRIRLTELDHVMEDKHLE